MNFGLLVQARTGSTRLPRKIFEDIGGKNLLEHILETCKNVNALKNSNTYKTAIICPDTDIEVLEWCKRREVPVFGGSETDLVKRYIDAIRHFNLDAALRITSDCPFISADVINECAKAVSESDYASNTMIRSYPEGHCIQGGTLKAWEWLDKNQKEQREHPWVIFDHNQLIRDKFYNDGLTYRHILNTSNIIFQKFSVDTKDDLNRLRRQYGS